MSSFSLADLVSALGSQPADPVAQSAGGLATLVPSDEKVSDGATRVLASPDAPTAALGLARAPLDDQQIGSAAGVVDALTARTGDPLRSRDSLVRTGAAIDSGLVPGGSELANLWNTYTTNPGALSGSGTAALLDHVEAVANATKDVPHPELKVGPGATITSVEPVEGGVQVDVSLHGEVGGVAAPSLTTAPPVKEPPSVAGPTLRVLPTGQVAVFGPVDEPTANTLRHLFPSVGGRWISGGPAPLRSVALDEGHESYDNNSMGEPHPATQPGTTVVFHVPDGRAQVVLGNWDTASNHHVRPLGQAVVDGFVQARQAVSAKDAKTAGKMAKELRDLTGAKGIVIYTHDHPGEGYTAVRDHLFSDGTRTVVKRSLDPELTSPNGYRAYVPTADSSGLDAKQDAEPVAFQERSQGVAGAGRAATIMYGHLPDKVSLDGASSITDIKIGRSKASHFAITMPPGQPPVISIGRSDQEAAAGYPGVMEATVRAEHGVVEARSTNPDDEAPAYRALALLQSLGVNTEGAKVGVGGTPPPLAPPPEQAGLNGLGA